MQLIHTYQMFSCDPANRRRTDFILVHYGDFSSEPNRRLYPIVGRLKQAMGHRLHYIFRHFSLGNRNPLSIAASMACEAARRQHRFWEMHGLLFERWDQIHKGSFLEFAMELGLDLVEFEKDMHCSEIFETIATDYVLGVQLGVDRPATLYINGHRYLDLFDFEVLVNACENSIGTYSWV